MLSCPSTFQKRRKEGIEGEISYCCLPASCFAERPLASAFRQEIIIQHVRDTMHHNKVCLGESIFFRNAHKRKKEKTNLSNGQTRAQLRCSL
jgi:hypothetical protein